MTDKDIIAQLLDLYPKWEDESHVASLRVSGIKRIIRQAYAEGVESGIKRQKAYSALASLTPEGKSADALHKLFGFK